MRVDFAGYDGCNSFYGEQPLLTVPISLVTKEPVADSGTLVTLTGCGDEDDRAFEVGPFGSSRP